MRNLDAIISARAPQFPYELIKQVPHERTFRCKQRESGTYQFGKHKEIELGPEYFMITLFGFFASRHIFLKLCFVLKRQSINAREHRVVLVPAPVCTCHAIEREGRGV